MSFSEASLLKKIQELNNTQQSVQTLSLWLIHHRKHSNTIVKTWLNELVVSKICDRKITFIYLANDILQNSRKRGAEFMKEFLAVLPDAIENTSRHADTKMRFTLERILNIWKDRKIYPDETIDELKVILHSQPKCEDSSPNDHNEKAPSKVASVTKSKITITQKDPASDAKKSEEAVKLDESSLKKESRKRKIPEKKADAKIDSTSSAAHLVELSTKRKKSLREEIAKELANSGTTIQTPEPLEIITMLQDLEKSASSDAVIRQKIAELPTKVTDSNGVKNLKDKKAALELLTNVNEAANLMDNYNTRLQQELASRKQTALLLAAYIRQQRLKNETDQKCIEEWEQKLKQVKHVENELQIHLKSLPDLSSIEEAAILTPLPSAGDLFSS